MAFIAAAAIMLIIKKIMTPTSPRQRSPERTRSSSSPMALGSSIRMLGSSTVKQNKLRENEIYELHSMNSSRE